MSTFSRRPLEKDENTIAARRQRRHHLLGLIAVLALIVSGVISLFSDRIFRSTPHDAPGKVSFIQRIDGSGAHVRVSHSPDLNPKEGENFILTAWYKFRKLPDNGESFLLLSKVDSFLRSQRGYRLSLTREAGRIRPVVYWRNSDSLGGYYKFSAMDLKPHQWVMFGLSFSEGRFLGLHTVVRTMNKKPEVSLLGGYTLSTPVYPDATSDLYFGSFAGPPYKGLIGPISISSLKKRTDSLYRIFKEFGVDYTPPADLFAEDDVKLFVDGARLDKSKSKHLVTFSSDIRISQEDDEKEEIEDPTAIVPAPAPTSTLSARATQPPVLKKSTSKSNSTRKKAAVGKKEGKAAGIKPTATARKSSVKRKKPDA